MCVIFFFFNDTATTEIYTLSLHDALPIYAENQGDDGRGERLEQLSSLVQSREESCSRDRKSTRLNSSHGYISYAVFCLKKKKNHSKPLMTNRLSHTLMAPSIKPTKLKLNI